MKFLARFAKVTLGKISQGVIKYERSMIPSKSGIPVHEGGVAFKLSLESVKRYLSGQEEIS